MTELLPCWFCGEKPNMYETKGVEIHGGKPWTVFCPDYHGTHVVEVFGMTKAEAIEAWNKRYPADLEAVPMTEENMKPYGWVRERTCLNEDDDETDAWFMCSECECHALIEYMGGGFGVPNYCPNCGAKVVEQ